MNERSRIPTATYRLQLNRAFTFRHAAAIVPYLSTLGVSHCYVSPYLKARAGSTHGYDIIDHNALNPEIGSAEDYDYFVAELHRHGMGQILDIVPNHMGVMGNDNEWWMDVLENGEASEFAEYFDIDWQPIQHELHGKVLIPILGEQYGDVLEKGELNLAFDAERGEFTILYHQHHFPVDPAEYPRILGVQIDNLKGKLSPTHEDFLELQSILTAFGHLPGRCGLSEEQRVERNREKEVQKRRLAGLAGRSAAVKEFVASNVGVLNGHPDDPQSFNALHELIKAQAYRLAQWRVAADEINYRRFFDINDLAALRMENDRVFMNTHRYVLDLVAKGKVDGLRIDHPDGLYDPAKYLRQLSEKLATENGGEERRAYVVVEKILTGKEELRKEWPVDGTTGYEFAELVNGLFVDPDAAARMTQTYRSFTGELETFGNLVYKCKKLMLKVVLASELNVLANLLTRIALANRHTCDFTMNSLRTALAEVIACFPVYRTYVNGREVSQEDRGYVEQAIAAGKKRSDAPDLSVFDFIRGILLVEVKGSEPAYYQRAVRRFAMKFQQVTAAVMAKGEEDTAFYRYNRLVSLNEVGGDPSRFGISVREFHRANRERLDSWPNSMLSSSTHDSKRSEDVRARIDAISEIAPAWRMSVSRWRDLNETRKKLVDGEAAPTRNDEYLLYQTLVGVWPVAGVKEAGWTEFVARIEQYMLKAAREAKQHTSWGSVKEEYESALLQFVRGVLDRESAHEFLEDFHRFQRKAARVGMFNSLSQCLLKLTAPGMPDVYQGNELWQFSLVDPDNRRPVDYRARMQALGVLEAQAQEGIAELAGKLVENLEDGRAKLYLTWKTLRLRRKGAEIFQKGSYTSLKVHGEKAGHVIAFKREHEGRRVIAAVPRLCAGIMGENGDTVCGEAVWRDTAIILPDAGVYRDILTGAVWEEKAVVPVAKLLRNFPVALLWGQR
jgi:(1->4)-alpha-D-glucan 1-alpha-D-glucosylmutase